MRERERKGTRTPSNIGECVAITTIRMIDRHDRILLEGSIGSPVLYHARGPEIQPNHVS